MMQTDGIPLYDKRTDDFQTAQWALATIAEACRNLIGGAA
jgi:hypothetical protein